MTPPFAWVALVLSCAALAQVAVLQIKVVQGDGAVHAPGSRSDRPLTVQVTDETGRPVEGAAVSFHIPDDGPGGVFSTGLRTDLVLTDAQGRATVRHLRFNRTPGPFQIRITVVKEQVRAGTVSSQYIAEAASAPAARAGGRRRWAMLFLLVAGAAGGGIAATALGSDAAAAAAPGPAPTPPLAVGPPSISVGRP